MHSELTQPIKATWRSWLIWGLATLYVLYQFLLQTSMCVMIPGLREAFNLDLVEVGFMSSIFFYSYILLQMPAGLMVDRFGARNILKIAILICAVVVTIFSLTTSPFVAYSMRLIMGIVVAPGFVSALYLAAKWFPSSQFPLIVGLTEALCMLGGALSEVILAPSVTAFGWRSTLLIFALLAILLAIFVWFIVQDEPAHVTKMHYQKTSKSSIWHDLFAVMKLPQAWINGLYAGLMFTIIQAFASLWAVPFLMQSYQFSLNQAAIISSMIFFGSVIGGPFIGWGVEKIGQYRLIMGLNAVLTTLTLLSIFYLKIQNPFLLGFLFFMLGFFCSSYVLPFSVIRDITSPAIRATAMGFVNMMCIIVGAPLLQPLIGKILSMDIAGTTMHHYQVAFMPLVLSVMLACLLPLWIKKKTCEVTPN